MPWGHCRGCRFFASETSEPSSEETARCQQTTLSRFDLRVSGDSGCNAFELRVGSDVQPQPPAA